MGTEIEHAAQTFDQTEFGLATSGRIVCRSAEEAVRISAALAPTNAGSAAIEIHRNDGRIERAHVLGRWGAVPDDYLAAFAVES